MSEEESNNENEENEDEEDNEEGEGEENEDEENEEDEDEGEEKEDDEEEDENEEGEEKEDDEEEEDEKEDKKKKKGKKGKKENKGKEPEEKKENETEEQKPQQSTKFSEDKLHPSKEIKMDLNLNNLNSSNSNNIYFNGNDITLANINPPKKSTLQLLSEISTEMDTLSSHLEEVLPKEKPFKYNIIYPISNTILNPQDLSYPNDNQDLEIKKLIEKAKVLTGDSILKQKKEENGENKIKTFEDKCCQSDDEIEYSYHQQLEENKSREEDYYNNNYNGDYNRRRFPYDPYKHLEYYNELRNNNEFKRRPLIYTQREFNNNNNYNNNFRGNDLRFERYKPGSVSQAMDILLDNK